MSARRVRFEPRRAEALAPDAPALPVDVAAVDRPSIPAWLHAVIAVPAVAAAGMLAAYLAVGAP